MTRERNAFGKYDCPERACDRKGEKGLPHPQGLGRHLQAIHGQPGRGPEAERRRERKDETALARRGEAPRHAVADVCVEPISPPSLTDPLHYCPGCGFDLDAAKQHLHPSIRDNAYIRCPQCRTNLAVVSAVLRPEIQTIPPERAMALVEAARRVSRVL
jgi:hypothetical protein